MKVRRLIYILLFTIPALTVISAQSLTGLPENLLIKKHLAATKQLKSTASEVSLNLPFFEDFTDSEVFPDPLKWADSDAFINASFPSDPVSYNVATLDAIDMYGNVYAINDQPVSSDKLTSCPFNLGMYEGGENTIILSFFYQFLNMFKGFSASNL